MKRIFSARKVIPASIQSNFSAVFNELFKRQRDRLTNHNVDIHLSPQGETQRISTEI